MTAHRFVHALTYDEKHASIWEMCFNTDDNSLIIFGFESVSIGMQSRAPSRIPLPSEPLSLGKCLRCEVLLSYLRLISEQSSSTL